MTNYSKIYARNKLDKIYSNEKAVSVDFDTKHKQK